MMKPLRPFLRRASLLSLAAALPLVACTADTPGPGSGGKKDASTGPTKIETPVLNNIPEATPHDTVAVRGTTNGERVVIQGGSVGNTTISVLPSGSFCADVPLKPNEDNKLTLYALADGKISDAVNVTVEQAPAAAAPPSPTCSGSTPTTCNQPEICANEVDDNCDGDIDICDRECNDCLDDGYEPNDIDLDVPVIPKGVYQLRMCPCRDDWFAVERNVGQRIRINLTFSHAQVPLNIRVYAVGPDGRAGDFVAGSFTGDDNESVDYTAEGTGLYYISVYSFGGTQADSGPYTMEVL